MERSGSSQTKGGEGQGDETEKETMLDRSGEEERGRERYWPRERGRKRRREMMKDGESSRRPYRGTPGIPDHYSTVSPRRGGCLVLGTKERLTSLRMFARYRHARTFITPDINPRRFIIARKSSLERWEKKLIF